MMEPVEAPKNETTYVGRAQVNFFQIKHLILAMQLWHRTGMKPIGHATVSGTVRIAEKFTGKTYPKRRKAFPEIIEDLYEVLGKAMKEQ
jgi:RNase P/RNase MRP subunit POP5